MVESRETEPVLCDDVAVAEDMAVSRVVSCNVRRLVVERSKSSSAVASNMVH